MSERDQQLAAVEQKLHAVVGERERWKETEIGRAGQTFPQRLAELREELDQTPRVGQTEARRSRCRVVTEERDRRSAENRAAISNGGAASCAPNTIATGRRWPSDGMTGWPRFAKRGTEWTPSASGCSPIGNVTDYDDWPQPTEPTPAIRFGELTLDLAQVKNGIPQDERLRPAETTMQLPALMTLDEHPVLLHHGRGGGPPRGDRRAAARRCCGCSRRCRRARCGSRFSTRWGWARTSRRSCTWPISTSSSSPAASGPTRGRSTSSSRGSRPTWKPCCRNICATSSRRSTNTTRRRARWPSRFRCSSWRTFPTNFSEAAARKLVSIATSGPRCGVYTLIMVDRKQKMPANFDLNDLAAGAVHLDWVSATSRSDEPQFDDAIRGESSARPQPTGEGRFRWRYPAFEHLPLALDRPPSAERFNDVLRAAGRAAKDSMKVEVPFEQVAPPENEYWTGDCGKELVVPIGRAGARRLQPVRLGKGTSQHLLVCGKTGSGKSTFLHALITNTALLYSPDEVEFYLIDFKKGVEFKTYATHHLPHARVIAIESEREFGLSVLERLDGELRRRGDLFRAAGRAGLARISARRGRVSAMPRVLLVVDEFQELFVEDDKLAQDADLLLDRLVRQGRAFGIHVLLGSQTLSGAYSLARSTMGQMAVRVALQCSEADANLILSDERNDGGPISEPSGRGDLQRSERPVGGQSSVPSGVAAGVAAD